MVIGKWPKSRISLNICYAAEGEVLRFLVRLNDDSERGVEAESYRLDDSTNRYLFVAKDNKEDQFIPAADVKSILREARLESTADMKHRIDRLDSHIKFEFELTAQRVTYLAIAESFLFGSYAAAVAAIKKDPAQSLDYSPPLRNLIQTVPWIGVVLAGAVFAAVLCAISMIFKLKAVREGLEGSYPGVHRDIGWKSLEHFVGLLPPIVIPASFFIAWLCVWPTK